MIIVVSVITGVVGTSVLIDSVRDGTLMFKDLIIPQWWLDGSSRLPRWRWAAGAGNAGRARTARGGRRSHEASEHVPGIRPEEMP